MSYIVIKLIYISLYIVVEKNFEVLYYYTKYLFYVEREENNG